MPNFKLKNYDEPGVTRVCRNINCLKPLATWQKYACSIACFHAYRSQKAAVHFECEVCHKHFTIPIGEVKAVRKRGVNIGRFCSVECSQYAKRKRPNVSIMCGYCGKAVDLNEVKWNKNRIPKYCDRLCMARAYKGRPHGKRKKRPVVIPESSLNETLYNMEGFIEL